MENSPTIITSCKGQPNYIAVMELIRGTYKQHGTYYQLFNSYNWKSSNRGLWGTKRSRAPQFPNWYCIYVQDLPDELICPKYVFGMGPDIDLIEAIDRLDRWFEEEVLDKLDNLC